MSTSVQKKSVTPGQRLLLRRLWSQGPASRSELAEACDLRRSDVTRLSGELIEAGLVREGRSEVAGRGRPRVPLQINGETGRVVGVTLEPGLAGVGVLDLLGRPAERPRYHRDTEPARLIEAAASMVREAVDASVKRVGISAAGLLDEGGRRLLVSAVTPGGAGVSLASVFDAAGDVPVIAQNDMHALTAQWLLARRIDEKEDVLVVQLRDGSIGAALIVDGRPNHGSVLGGNELGHTRLPVETDKCFCGSRGCLERVFSTAYLRRLDPGGDDLATRAARFAAADPPLQRVIDLLAMAVSNAVNFVRPSRLVIVSPFTRHTAFADALVRRIRSGTLEALVQRLRIDRWDETETDHTDRAGWLALADLFLEGWNPAEASGSNGANGANGA